MAACEFAAAARTLTARIRFLCALALVLVYTTLRSAAPTTVVARAFITPTPESDEDNDKGTLPRAAVILYGMLGRDAQPGAEYLARVPAAWANVLGADFAVDVFYSVPSAAADVGPLAGPTPPGAVADLRARLRAAGSERVAVEACGADLTAASVVLVQRAGLPFISPPSLMHPHRTFSFSLSIAASLAVFARAGRALNKYAIAIVGRIDTLNLTGVDGTACLNETMNGRIPVMRGGLFSNLMVEDRLFAVPPCVLPALGAALRNPTALVAASSRPMLVGT